MEYSKYLGDLAPLISARDFKGEITDDMDEDTVRADAPKNQEISEGTILIIARLILCQQYKFTIDTTPTLFFF